MLPKEADRENQESHFESNINNSDDENDNIDDP